MPRTSHDQAFNKGAAASRKRQHVLHVPARQIDALCERRFRRHEDFWRPDLLIGPSGELEQRCYIDND